MKSISQNTKFIIFGQGRSGSNLLVNILNSHEKIDCRGELFNQIHFRDSNIFQRAYFHYFPYQLVLKNYHSKSSEVFGFKLMPYQLSKFQKLKRQIFDGTWKIIHLQRNNNLLKTISNTIADKNGIWLRKDDQAGDNTVYTLDPEELLKRMRWKKNELEGEYDLLKTIDHINIFYEEDLLKPDQWVKTANKIFDYLDLASSEINVSVAKTDYRSYRERISNYTEIYEYISKTEFSDELQDFI